MFDLHNERCEAKKGDLLFVCVLVQRERGRGGRETETERERQRETETGRVCLSGLVFIQGDWSEVVWGGLEVVWGGLVVVWG